MPTSTIELVCDFHHAFGHPVENKPTIATEALRVLRIKLIAEELLELARASGCSLIASTDPCKPETNDFIEVLPRLATVNLIEMADALGDLDYVVQGANLVFGLPSYAIVEEIHRSNMSKLGADGKPLVREDGKILKGPGYFKPDIARVLEDV